MKHRMIYLYRHGSFRSTIKGLAALSLLGCVVALALVIFNTPFKGGVGGINEPRAAVAHYQFTPTSGTITTGASTTITAAAAASTEGTNVGSYKGTFADDGYHWVVAGENPGGIAVALTVGGAQLNGANKLIIQTEIDLDPTVLATEVQICDFVSSTSVDDAADGVCTGGGWRTVNNRNASQVPVALTNTGAVAYQWHIYDGYWSTGATGGTTVNTPLTNFVNGADNIIIRYYSETNTTSQLAIDFLRIYAVIDPVYHAAGFTQLSGGTPTGHYGNTFGLGNVAGSQITVTGGDGVLFDVPGTVATTTDYYLTFKNVKTYTGMNTILVNAESLCSAATAGLQYRFKIRNFTNGTWEDISQPLDCSATGFFNNFALNNVIIDDYINDSNEIWVGLYALSNSTTNIRVDSIYLMLGTTNSDTNQCEISLGTNTAGRIATNPSAPGSDRIETMRVDANHLYLAGFDSTGIDNRWRIEKRTTTDGALVTAFGTDGVVTSDPSTGADQILAIASTSDALFLGGYDNTPANFQWRIEKRDPTDGSLITTFDTDGIIQFNPAADGDQITSMTADDTYLYVTGFEDDDTGVWRIHKYDASTGAPVLAFGTNGSTTQTLAGAGDERPQRIKVDGDYLYIAGWDNVAGNLQWRIEKRNKTTGALCAGGGECAAGAFDTDGVIQTNPSANADRVYALAIDDTHIYVGGEDSSVSAANSQWRIEKRDIATGALVTAFDTDGIVLVNPNTALDWVTDLLVDDTHLYLTGLITSTAGIWRTEKRDITTGALVTSFGGEGVSLSEDGGDDRPNAIGLSADALFIAGYGTAPGDNQWLIEKRSTSTGLRTNDSFGDNDCTGTRNIDITGGNRDAWTILSDDESTTMSTPFYALDNDGDAVVEEATSANLRFPVTVPNGAAVTGIYWAGRSMSGAGGTVRFALKDYSGLTGTTGGRSAVGANLTSGMAYNDPLTTQGIGSGGLAGYMTNPEDYIDTVNNEMSLSLLTTSGGATSTNAVAVWDFGMVSFSWVEVTPSPVYSIAITSDGVIEYGSLNLNTSSSTVGGDTQIAENTAIIPERINIRSSNAIGGNNWLLASITGTNIYTHEFSTTTGASWIKMPDSSTYVVADAALGAGNTLSLDFRITTPVGTTDFSQKNITITVQAVAP
jgi:hypothetical protein